MLVVVDVELAVRQVLKEQVDRRRAVVFHALFRGAATFNDLQEFRELDLATPIVIDGRNNVLDLLAGVDEPEGDQRILQFVDSYGAAAVGIQRVEIRPQLF